MFLVVFFFPSPLGVYISKKWLTVDIRFHLHFWKSQILKFALLPCSCEYKCELLALWLRFFWWVHGFFMFSQNCFLTSVSSPFSSIHCLTMDFGASPVWLAWLSHLWVSTCFVRSVAEIVETSCFDLVIGHIEIMN